MEALMLLVVLVIIGLGIYIEWKIGIAVGKAITKGTGIFLGIILILIGFTLFIGIAVIMYSNKNKSDEKPLNLPSANFNLNTTNEVVSAQSNNNNFSKFVGKNYKDILLENGLNDYVSLFENNKLTDISIISSLTDNDLEKLGITIMGDRKLIIKIFSGI